MTLEKFMEIFNTLTKGAFTKVAYQKVNDNGYSKETTTTIRFVDYYNIETIKQLNRQPTTPNPNVETIIPHILTLNKKTGNYLVHLYFVPNAKTITIYKDNNGNEIDKATYETMVPPKKKYHSNTPSVMFQVKLQDLVSLG